MSSLFKNIVISDNDFKAYVSLYASKDSSRKSLVILPPTGGTNLIDRSYAKKFSAAGFDVYILDTWTGMNEINSDLEIHQNFYGASRKAMALVLEQIKTPFIGLLGTSVGALHASLALTTLPRVNAAFLIVGGAPVIEVILDSDHKVMRQLLMERKKRFGFQSSSENLEAVNKVFNLEPMEQVGELYKNRAIGMVIAKKDSTVPYKYQLKLKEYFKPTQVITLNSSHFMAILKTWLLHSKDILNFLTVPLRTSTKLYLNDGQEICLVALPKAPMNSFSAFKMHACLGIYIAINISIRLKKELPCLIKNNFKVKKLPF